MTIQQMRVYISQHPMYKGSTTWKVKCQTMPDRQVVAIYNHFRNLDYKKMEKELQATKKSNVKYHQMDIFEYMEEQNK